MLKKIGYIFILIILVTSCKSKSVATGSSIRSMSANKVIKNHYKNSFDKESITAKMKVKYRGKTNLPSVTASMRIKKDETIWISLSKIGFPVGKVLITKDKVSYYEKINRTYFEGDFALLSGFLGTELDYEKVQNLLLGQAILNLKNEKHSVDLKEKSYELTPKKANSLFDIFYLINSGNYKIAQQRIEQAKENKKLTIDYSKYEKIDGEFFPKKVLITAKDHNFTNSVDVDYKSVQFNKAVSFPFSIPKGYKEIKLK